MTKPENSTLPPELYYENAVEYKNSTRLNYIQSKITNAALDLVIENDNRSLFILDLGCGTGMSGDSISERGHFWIGCDISMEMLVCALDSKIHQDEQSQENIDHDSESCVESSSIQEEYTVCQKGDPIAFLNLDISKNLPFKAGSFDIVVSISCIQWLFHNKSLYEARKSVRNLFVNCKAILTLKGKAVFQFYNSKCSERNDMLMEEAKKAGFFAELVTTGRGRNTKTFLVLDCHRRNAPKQRSAVKKINQTLLRIGKFKERRIKKGKHVAKDSKYSGRKRAKKFI